MWPCPCGAPGPDAAPRGKLPRSQSNPGEGGDGGDGADRGGVPTPDGRTQAGDARAAAEGAPRSAPAARAGRERRVVTPAELTGLAEALQRLFALGTAAPRDEAPAPFLRPRPAPTAG